MIKRTETLPPLQLTDPIWTIEHIAAALRTGVRAARDVIARTDFPGASFLSDARNSRAYWLQSDVLAWLREQKRPATTSPRPAEANAAPQAAAVAPTKAAPHRSSANMDEAAALAFIQSQPTKRDRSVA